MPSGPRCLDPEEAMVWGHVYEAAMLMRSPLTGLQG